MGVSEHNGAQVSRLRACLCGPFKVFNLKTDTVKLLYKNKKH